MSYTYDPSKCMDGGLNQMRMELGDTAIDMEGISSALCDEEYQAILNAYPKQWKRAKLKCLQSILMKISYEVDTSVDGLSYSLNQRAERWQKMYDSLKQELKITVPIANKGALSPPNGEYYFYNDMQKNPRRG